MMSFLKFCVKEANHCLIIRQINNDSFLFTEEVSNTVFIKKSTSTVPVSTMDTWKPSKKITQDEDFKALMTKYEVKNENDNIFYVGYLLRYLVEQKQQ